MNVIPESLRTPYETYLELVEKNDPHVGWPFLHSPIPTLVLTGLYLYCAKVLGPRLMENRKPLKVRGWMMLYNLTMVIVNSYLFIKFGIHGWFGRYNWICQPMDYSNSYHSVEMTKTCYLYLITKFVDFLDTFFFIVRKKFDHVNLLHLFHHGIMPIFTWTGHIALGGHGTFGCFLNSLVHAVMYTYYGLSSFGPEWQKYLWWKKYITSLQIVQFIMVFIHNFQILFIPCDWPVFYVYEVMAVNVLFLILFLDYFKKTYPKKVELMK